MTNIQRMRSDIATMDKRKIADNTKRDKRDRNDGLTGERRFKADKGEIASSIIRNNRIKNDDLTEKKRFDADKTTGNNRLKNDVMTANRRDLKDANRDMALAISLLILLAIGVYFIFI
jgi:hypothetical protein